MDPIIEKFLIIGFIWESLCGGQKIVYWERWWALDGGTHDKANKIARELAKEVIDPRFVDYLGEMTLELISAHLYIERNIPFTITPLIFDL